jgi:cytochrome b6-f complex iron-sulfur subunit
MQAGLVLAEINALALVAVIAVVVIGGGVAVVAAFTRRDTNNAIGYLSRETVKRDVPASISPLGQVATGKEIERLAEAERKGELVTVAAPADVVPFVPPDPDTIGVTRRQFFNRSIIAFMGLGLSGFGAAVIAFLWPQPKGGFGSKIRVGKIADIQAQIEAGKGFYYLPEGRMWITSYPLGAVEKAKAVYPQQVLNALEAGVCPLYQKCPHLGCRVPSCPTSQWFECPCHGSQYNQAGEKKGGPAPRGMDRFATEVSDGVLTVDTGTVIQGPPIGVNTTGQEAEGPHCVGAGGGH